MSQKQFELRQKLLDLQAEHQALECFIKEEQIKPLPDQLLLQRYKRKKLHLKEQIVTLENELLPDIIA